MRIERTLLCVSSRFFSYGLTALFGNKQPPSPLPQRIRAMSFQQAADEFICSHMQFK
jgi:hypothetical protein